LPEKGGRKKKCFPPLLCVRHNTFNSEEGEGKKKNRWPSGSGLALATLAEEKGGGGACDRGDWLFPRQRAPGGKGNSERKKERKGRASLQKLEAHNFILRRGKGKGGKSSLPKLGQTCFCRSRTKGKERSAYRSSSSVLQLSASHSERGGGKKKRGEEVRPMIETLPLARPRKHPNE